jgi:class 3 adenylate cyclase
MIIFDTLQTALAQLSANKLRTGLTMLGIVIGVGAVIALMAAGKGFSFADKGEATLKGFEKPVRLHEVRWQG